MSYSYVLFLALSTDINQVRWHNVLVTVDNRSKYSRKVVIWQKREFRMEQPQLFIYNTTVIQSLGGENCSRYFVVFFLWFFTLTACH